MQLIQAQIILGLFAFLTLVSGSMILRHYEQPWISWLLLSIVALSLTLAFHMQYVVGNPVLFEKFFTAGIALFALVGLGNFWDIIRLTQ